MHAGAENNSGILLGLLYFCDRGICYTSSVFLPTPYHPTVEGIGRLASQLCILGFSAPRVPASPFDSSAPRSQGRIPHFLITFSPLSHHLTTMLPKSPLLTTLSILLFLLLSISLTTSLALALPTASPNQPTPPKAIAARDATSVLVPESATIQDYVSSIVNIMLWAGEVTGNWYPGMKDGGYRFGW
ncbi:hypothetical protein P154DRAFT_574524 [Amniculicola lignicola CBS 123094]|uniref:Uncharacterized protein n=1 Tax=Amniculicola lignicola CBS 123094 TaxID=1392246 RepID=A0A6A5WW52_9PLEO|nr:hypothetical protein P154DRAFT_574524 [Amniculicola lignicola CBS 123094]